MSINTSRQEFEAMVVMNPKSKPPLTSYWWEPRPKIVKHWWEDFDNEQDEE